MATEANTELNTSQTETVPNIDEDDRKLFVGGLNQETTEADLRTHFSQYGEIANVNLKIDQTSNRSRGFGFVLYREVKSLNDAVAAESHTIKDKKVAVKKAEAKAGKIYVGKLKLEFSEDDIKEHFSQFGTVTAVEQPFDKLKNEKRNFCFVSFEKEVSTRQLLKDGLTTINGHECEIKRVTPKPPMSGAGGFGQGHQGLGGGMRGGRGGCNQWGNPNYNNQWGGFGAPQGGEFWGGAAQGFGGFSDPYFGAAGWGAAGWGSSPGGYGGFGGGMNAGFGGGKSPRGGAARGRGGRGGGHRGQRQKPY